MALRNPERSTPPPAPDSNPAGKVLTFRQPVGTATREQSRAGSDALTASRRDQEADSHSVVAQVAKGAIPVTATVLLGEGMNLAHDHVSTDIPNVQQVLHAVGSALGLGKPEHPAPPAAASSTAGTGSNEGKGNATPTPTELTSAQVQADLAAMTNAMPGHKFTFNTGSFYDVTDAAHPVQVAQFSLTADGKTGNLVFGKTPSDEGHLLANKLAIAQQAQEVASGSKNVSVLCPIDLPPGATYTVETTNIGPSTALVFHITFKDGGTVSIMNPYATKSYVVTSVPAYDFPDGQKPGVQLSNPDGKGYYDKADIRALVDIIEINPSDFTPANNTGTALPGQTEGTIKVNAGQTVNAYVQETSQSSQGTPVPFVLNGSSVVLG